MKASKIKCYGSGTQITVSVGERMRGYTHCPCCGKQINVSYTTKTKTIGSHNEVTK